MHGQFHSSHYSHSTCTSVRVMSGDTADPLILIMVSGELSAIVVLCFLMISRTATRYDPSIFYTSDDEQDMIRERPPPWGPAVHQALQAPPETSIWSPGNTIPRGAARARRALMQGREDATSSSSSTSMCYHPLSAPPYFSETPAEPTCGRTCPLDRVLRGAERISGRSLRAICPTRMDRYDVIAADVALRWSSALEK